jgi:hypothetical protein
MSSRCDHLPHDERDVFDPVVYLGAARTPELAQTGVRRVETDHAFDLRHRDEQWAVGVALTEQCVDFEHGMGRIGGLDARAVVDDPLEHRQRPEPHATMLADVDDR